MVPTALELGLIKPVSSDARVRIPFLTVPFLLFSSPYNLVVADMISVFGIP
jgi:hypothetical protein